MPADSVRLLAEGKVDAYMAFPPEPYELLEKKIGHVVVNTTTPAGWAQRRPDMSRVEPRSATPVNFKIVVMVGSFDVRSRLHARDVGRMGVEARRCAG